MKICIISNLNSQDFYGSSTRPYYISKHLSELGNDILHITTAQCKYNNGIRYIRKGHFENKIKIIRRIRSFLYILKEIQKFDPDIIYPHQLGNANYALRLNVKLNKKIIYDAHSSSYFETVTIPNDQNYEERKKIRKKEEKILNKVNSIITVSTETKKFFIKEFSIPDNKINIIKNGTDTNMFRPGEKNENILKRMGIPKNGNICVFANRRSSDFQTSYQALYYFFEIVPEIEKEIENIKFLILGGGPEPTPPSKNVIYTGFVEEFPAYLNLADIFIAPFPPKAVCGGTRNKICDYLACGKPIISTIEGMRGFDDAIPGKHYLLGKDTEDFVDKIIYCLNNPEESKKIGRNARELSKNYDWQVLSKEVEKILKRLSE